MGIMRNGRPVWKKVLIGNKKLNSEMKQRTKFLCFVFFFYFSLSLASFLKQSPSSQDEDKELMSFYQNELKKGTRFNLTSEDNNFSSMKFLSKNSDVMPIPESFNSGFSKTGTSAYIISKSEKGLTSDRKKLMEGLDYHHTDPPPFLMTPIQAEIAFNTAKIVMGGHQAKRALERLNSIANHVNMDVYLNSFLPTALACKSLLIRESEKWENRQLCQSLYVRITNVPVTTQFANMKNGFDYGFESSIIMPRPSRIYRPDREVEKLRAGADLNHILDDKPLEY